MKNILNALLYKLRLTKIRTGLHVRFLNCKKSIVAEESVKIEDGCIFDGSNRPESIFLGKNAKICNHTTILTAGGQIRIGSGCQIGAENYYTAQGGITIGNNVITASKVSMVSSEHNYKDISRPIMCQGSYHKAIIIGSGCWIGLGVTILAGTTIGRNCVIGANSLVKGTFPDYCVIAGNPAKIIKRYNTVLRIWEKQTL